MVSIEELLNIAKEKEASDLHITAGVPPILRIHGALEYLPFDVMLPDMTDAMILPIMHKDQRAVFDKEGEVDFSYSILEIGRFRVNIFRQRGSVAAAVRLIGSEIPSPNVLGIPGSIQELYKRKRGLVLVTGPTGSGKSTSLAAIVNEINVNRSAHVITLEDPIEYLHKHQKSIVTQREIGRDTHNYANALRAALRQDPDVILVGEMRDLETISTAVTAAETGHLVLSTLHTTGAVNTIERIIDVFPPYQQQQMRVQLASVLVAVMSQQLIPAADEKGRCAAFEVLHTSPAVRNLIRENSTQQIVSVMQASKQIGMQTMNDAILDLVRSGTINRDDALTFAQESSKLKI